MFKRQRSEEEDEKIVKRSRLINKDEKKFLEKISKRFRWPENVEELKKREREILEDDGITLDYPVLLEIAHQISRDDLIPILREYSERE